MKIGLNCHLTDYAISGAELAREAEARGFYSLYVPEHTHIPASRRTPAPTGTPELDEEYFHTLDPFVVIGAMASVTSQIRLGTSIALVAQHDPIALAKAIASADFVSGGRLVLGIGIGWNIEEMQNHGVDPRRRRAHVREVMLAMCELWSKEVASFEGEFVRFEASYQWPKPIQQPRPTVLYGGAARPALFEHIAEYCDGWIPIGGAGLKAALGDLRAAYEAKDRDFAAAHIVPSAVIPDDGKLAYYASIGVTELALRVPNTGRDDALAVLDDYARYAEQYD